jgi:hypothetical protein
MRERERKRARRHSVMKLIGPIIIGYAASVAWAPIIVQYLLTYSKGFSTRTSGLSVQYGTGTVGNLTYHFKLAVSLL